MKQKYFLFLDTRVQYANRYVLLNYPRQSVTIELSVID